MNLYPQGNGSRGQLCKILYRASKCRESGELSSCLDLLKIVLKKEGQHLMRLWKLERVLRQTVRFFVTGSQLERMGRKRKILDPWEVLEAYETAQKDTCSDLDQLRGRTVPVDDDRRRTGKGQGQASRDAGRQHGKRVGQKCTTAPKAIPGGDQRQFPPPGPKVSEDLGLRKR